MHLQSVVFELVDFVQPHAQVALSDRLSDILGVALAQVREDMHGGAAQFGGVVWTIGSKLQQVWDETFLDNICL